MKKIINNLIFEIKHYFTFIIFFIIGIVLIIVFLSSACRYKEETKANGIIINNKEYPFNIYEYCYQNKIYLIVREIFPSAGGIGIGIEKTNEDCKEKK